MRFLCIVILVLVSNSCLLGQLLASENFDATAGTEIRTLPGWSLNGPDWSLPFVVSAEGLVFYGYEGSGIGRGAQVNANTSSDDIALGFAAKNSGSVYASFMINISSAGSIYFVGFKQTLEMKFFSQLSARDEGNGTFKFGLRPGYLGDITYTASTFSYNTTYLVVIKHQILGGVKDDVSSVFIFSNIISSIEPASPDISVVQSATDDPLSINAFFIDQTSSAANCIIDGIRIATTWTNAPLPVELTSFTANLTKYNVQLNWETATETMNHGFEVERSLDKSNWKKVGFVQGNGNSNSPKQYGFEDRISAAGNLFYRLKQIDTDGTVEYSEPIEVLVAMPTKVELHQNFPNPFNPATTISYSLPHATFVNLKVYDISGQLVQTLVSGMQVAGVHSVSFNGEGLPSGMYFLYLQTESGVEVKKIQLMK